MDRFNWADLEALIRAKDSPCVSLFMATNRGGAEQDLVLGKELLNEAKQRLIDLGMRRPDAMKLIGQAQEALGVEEFWHEVSDGLALFFTTRSVSFFRLPLAMPNLVVAGPRFHVKPLLPWLASDGRFNILAISQNHVRLLEGTAHTIQQRAIPNLPESLAEAEAIHDRDEPLNYHTHPAPVGRSMTAVFHGQGVGIDDHKNEILHYFQKVDQALMSEIRADPNPMVLATVDYLGPIYRKASKHPCIVTESVKGNADYLSDTELHARAWPLVAPIFKMSAAKRSCMPELGRWSRRSSKCRPRKPWLSISNWRGPGGPRTAWRKSCRPCAAANWRPCSS
jgi:hypothetical protein